jgi:cell division protein FtsW (lipid II flippase)
MKELASKGKTHWLLLLNLTGVGAVGLVNLYSAASSITNHLVLTQAAWFAVGLCMAVFLSFVDYRMFEKVAYPLFVFCLLSLLSVLVFGRVVNNSRRWLSFLSINVQPSEMMKIAVILALAKYFSDDAGQIRTRSAVSRLLIKAHPLFPLGSGVVLLLGWDRIEQESIRWIFLGLCLVWEVLAVIYFFLLRRVKLKVYSRVMGLQEKGYTLDDLIKPASVLYPLGFFGALSLFWEQKPLPELGAWRFLLLAICLVWAAVTVVSAIHDGRTKVHAHLSPVILAALPAVLIMRQPDLGTALVLLATAASMVLFIKVRMRSFFLAVGVLLVSMVAAWFFVLKPYQKDRINAFISPSADTQDRGYHARQSIIAVGSGQFFGKGYGLSTQTKFQFLPEHHTDFVFSVWAEEWGFVGCLLALLMFLGLLVLIVSVASYARDRFGVLICVGVAALIFWQVFINIGMVIGVAPVVGLTLPLWSYGGSSVLTLMIGFGWVLSVSYHKSSY